MPSYRKNSSVVYLTKSGKGVTWRKLPESRLTAWLNEHWKPIAFLAALAGGYGCLLLFTAFEHWVYLTYWA